MGVSLEDDVIVNGAEAAAATGEGDEGGQSSAPADHSDPTFTNVSQAAAALPTTRRPMQLSNHQSSHPRHPPPLAAVTAGNTQDALHNVHINKENMTAQSVSDGYNSGGRVSMESPLTVPLTATTVKPLPFYSNNNDNNAQSKTICL
jgi:hypothetical protein